MINFSAPLNSLSFGFVTFHLLREFYKKNLDVNYFPIGGNVDISSYPAARSIDGFEDWLKKSIYNNLENLNKNNKTLSLWHINGSEQSYGSNRNLLTFHELDNLTKTEINILRNQDQIFLTSKYSQQIFNNFGINSVYCPLGFDSLHFKKTNRKYFNDDRVVFGLVGKLEISRKAHAKVIQNWIKKFGNDRRYYLHLHVYNSFLSPDQNSQLLLQIMGGNKPFNVNILPYVKDLNSLNECFNAIDIIIDMSRGEAFSLPSFHCLALGKHGIIHNATAMKDWANEKNAVLVNSSSKIEPYDNIFFHKGQKFNQGMLLDWNDDEFCHALNLSLKRFYENKINEEGLKLQNSFTLENTASIILNNLK